MDSFRQELLSLSGNTKGMVFLLAFRMSAWFSRGRIRRVFGAPVRMLYKILVQWMLGIDIPDRTDVGFGIEIFHGQGIVVHQNVIIGRHVRLHQNTTIGVAKDGGAVPVIGDHVKIGANSVVIGGIRVGDRAVIAAGAVVIRDVAPDSLVAGNPAREVKKL